MRPLAILALLLTTACATTPPPPVVETQPAPQPVVQAQPEPQPAPAPAETRPRGPITVPILARGLTCRSAIPVDATNEHDGIALENAWITENYPGAKKVSQALITCNDKPADQVNLETANGRSVSLYFDISKWFGKH